MCFDHFESLTITLFRIVHSQWFLTHSTQLEELFQVSYYLNLYPQKWAYSPFNFSIFRGLYLDPYWSDQLPPPLARLSFSSSFEWHITRPGSTFLKKWLILTQIRNLMSFDSARRALANDINCPYWNLGHMNKFFHEL